MTGVRGMFLQPKRRPCLTLPMPARSALLRLGAALCFATFATSASGDEWGSMQLLGREIPAGTSQRFAFVPDRTFESSYLNMPVFVARGAEAGTN